MALENDEAIEPPEGEGDAVGEGELEVVDGLEGGDLTGEMCLPVGFILDDGDNGRCGEDAVAQSVGGGRAPGLGRPAARTRRRGEVEAGRWGGHGVSVAAGGERSNRPVTWGGLGRATVMQ